MNGQRISSKKQVFDFIEAEAKRQGVKDATLSVRVGYAKTYLYNMKRANAISLQASVDFLQSLGYTLAIVPITWHDSNKE